MEFFELLEQESERKEIVCKEVASNDFARLLREWKIAKKVLRKMKSNSKDNLDAIESAKDLIIESIMDGNLVIENDVRTSVHIKHNLLIPIEDIKGEPIITELIYRKVPKIVDLRKMDEFEEKEHIAKMQALAAAMSGKTTKELAGLSSADIDILGALVVFFV